MKLTFPERLVLIILSALLVTGAVILHLRYSRPGHEITIIENGAEKRLMLKQVEERLRENRKVDINASAIEEIAAIPGLGEILAARIIERRTAGGKFIHADDLLEVKGIGEKKLERIKEYIRIE